MTTLTAHPTTTPRTAARIGAAGFVGGGALWIAEGVADAVSPGYPLAHVLGPVVVLLLAGFVGLAVFQHPRTGRLGLVGLALILPSLVLDGGYKFDVVPEDVVTVAMPALLLGLVLYAAATWRARLLPGWVPVASVVVWPLPMVEGLGTAVGGLLFAAIGVALWLRSAATTAPAPVA